MTPARRKLSEVWIAPNAAARLAEIFNQPAPPKPPFRRKSDKGEKA